MEESPVIVLKYCAPYKNLFWRLYSKNKIYFYSPESLTRRKIFHQLQKKSSGTLQYSLISSQVLLKIKSPLYNLPSLNRQKISRLTWFVTTCFGNFTEWRWLNLNSPSFKAKSSQHI